MYNSIELFYHPRKELSSKISLPPGEPEMTEFDSAFLCGMLKAFKPAKILEIGVAGGGTTAIIIQCMQMLNLNYSLISIDLLEEAVFSGKTKNVGFVAEQAKETVPELRNADWKLYSGTIAPNVIDKIGADIDFLILDTSHVLPGELLDFLALLPYLKNGAIVLLHDLCNNWSSSDEKHFNARTKYSEMANATKQVLNTVSAIKYLMKDPSAPWRNEHPNIGAFKITEETYANIIDCFSLLTSTWCFDIDDRQLEDYRRCIFSHDFYDDECKWMFDCAETINRNIQSAPTVRKDFKSRLRRAAGILLKGR